MMINIFFGNMFFCLVRQSFYDNLVSRMYVMVIKARIKGTLLFLEYEKRTKVYEKSRSSRGHKLTMGRLDASNLHQVHEKKVT